MKVVYVNNPTQDIIVQRGPEGPHLMLTVSSINELRDIYIQSEGADKYAKEFLIGNKSIGYLVNQLIKLDFGSEIIKRGTPINWT